MRIQTYIPAIFKELESPRNKGKKHMNIAFSSRNDAPNPTVPLSLKERIKHFSLGILYYLPVIGHIFVIAKRLLNKNHIDKKPEIIDQNIEKHIYHPRGPNQMDVFKNSPYAKADKTSEYNAQYTTCGWVASYLAHTLSQTLDQDTRASIEKIQKNLNKSNPDAFIRNSSHFVDDLTAYGGSCDKVEGLLLGQDIYSILKGMKTLHLENVFIIEGAAEKLELKCNENKLEVFNTLESFRANFENPAEFEPLKKAIGQVATGEKPFLILISLETFPVGAHFITYTFRKNSKDELECLIFEGLNESHKEWVLSGESSTSQDPVKRATTEWLYNLLEEKQPTREEESISNFSSSSYSSSSSRC